MTNPMTRGSGLFLLYVGLVKLLCVLKLVDCIEGFFYVLYMHNVLETLGLYSCKQGPSINGSIISKHPVYLCQKSKHIVDRIDYLSFPWRMSMVYWCGPCIGPNHKFSVLYMRYFV